MNGVRQTIEENVASSLTDDIASSDIYKMYPVSPLESGGLVSSLSLSFTKCKIEQWNVVCRHYK